MFAEFGITPEVMLSFVHIERRKVLSDFAEAVFKLPPKVYTHWPTRCRKPSAIGRGLPP